MSHDGKDLLQFDQSEDPFKGLQLKNWCQVSSRIAVKHLILSLGYKMVIPYLNPK